MVSTDALLSAAPLLADERARLAPYRLGLVSCSSDPRFDAAYRALAAYFGPRGQLEARADLARLVDASRSPWICEGVAVVRPLLVLMAADGSLAAVAERYVAFDPDSGLLSGLDANLLVLPAHRGRGLGPVLERLVVHAGQALLSGHGAGRHRLGIELGDLEPLHRSDIADIEQPPSRPDGLGSRPSEPGAARDAVHSAGRPLQTRLHDALRRIWVWGQSSYGLLLHSSFPLSLVGMQGEGEQAARPPVPMLAMLRIGISRDRVRAPSIAKAWLHTLTQHLYAAHAWADAEAAAQERSRQQAAVAAAATDPVPLFPLPQSRDATIPDFLCLP